MPYILGMQNPFSFRPTPQQAAKSKASSAISAVQSSLFMRLAKAYPHTRGPVAWVLVWAATPSHKKHGEALACLRSVPAEELEGLRETAVSVVNATGRENDEAWQDLACRITELIDSQIAERTRGAHKDMTTLDAPAPVAVAVSLRLLRDGQIHSMPAEHAEACLSSGLWERA